MFFPVCTFAGTAIGGGIKRWEEGREDELVRLLRPALTEVERDDKDSFATGAVVTSTPPEPKSALRMRGASEKGVSPGE